MTILVNVHREFVRSRQRLTPDEQKAVDRLIRMTMEGNLTPGMRRHYVGAFLSLSPNMDLRIVYLEENGSINLIYVDHHDRAYLWASSRKPALFSSGIELFPAFLQEAVKSDDKEISGPALLDRLGTLYGNDDQVLTYIEGLSPEWQEWFFQGYVEKVRPWPEMPSTSSLTYCLNDVAVNDALKLDMPEWLTFLHPAQKRAVQIRGAIIAITGGPGTGKTVVLLNRLIVPPSSPDRRRVLLTYSQSLVNHYRDIARNLKKDAHHNFSIFNVESLRCEPGSSKQPPCEIHAGRLYVRTIERQLVEVEELLVDEFQDCPTDVIGALRLLAENGLAVTVGGDLDQMLFRKNRRFVDSFISNAAEKINLSYCYRSSKQLVCAYQAITSTLLSQFNLPLPNYSGPATFALSGPPLCLYTAKSLSEQIARCDELLGDALQRYPHESVAVIFLQFPNPAFKGGSREEAALKNHPRLGKHYVFAPLAKGREYFAGIVFVSNTFMARNLGEENMRLRVNTMFVALSRFRDECSVVYTEDAVIEPALRSAGIALCTPSSFGGMH